MALFVYIFFFFFSSRRRHTRWNCDWSSDVCSSEALAISDRIAVMDRGRVQQIGTPVEIYHHPANRFVADFVGLANFVEAEVAGPDTLRGGKVILRVALDGTRQHAAQGGGAGGCG